jgi:O-antigen/teichoic acid export membrane protein
MSSEFVRAVISRALAVAAALISSLLALRLFSRYLGPEVYGTMLLASQILIYLPMLDAGFRTVVSRRLLAGTEGSSRQELIDFAQHFYTWFGIVILVGSLLSMVGFAFSSPAKLLEHRVGLFAALAVSGAVSVYVASQIGLLIGLQAQSQAYLLNTLGSLVYLLVLWIGFKRGAGAWSIPAATFFSACLCLLPAVGLIKRQNREIRILQFTLGERFWNLFQRLKTEAFASFKTHLVMVLLYSIDLILVGIFCSAQTVAVYGILSRLITIVRSFLQTLGDVSWPIVARRGLGHQPFNAFLVRINAWIYGSITGAMCLTVIPFCKWYLGEQWTASAPLVYLLVARLLVTGLDGPVAYFLYAAGDYQAIAKYLQRELIAAVLLSLAAAPLYGSTGIACAFFLATAFGTAFPIMQIYCRKAGCGVLKFLGQIWWRASLAFVISFGSTVLLMGYFPDGLQSLIPAVVAVMAGVSLSLLVSLLRNLRNVDLQLSGRPWSLYHLLRGI